MSQIACPHCSQPIQDDPSLAGSAAVCPHCDNEFQFPEAPKPAKRAAAPAASKRSAGPQRSAGSQRSAGGKTMTTTRSKPEGKPQPGDKSKPTRKEKPKFALQEMLTSSDPKLLAAKVAIAVVLGICVLMYLFVGRKRDYSAERQAVLSYISSNMPKAKFDSWHGEGIGKGCTIKNGKKVPDDSVVLRAHVLVGDRIAKYKKDIVFIVERGRVTDEVEPRDFHLPAGSGK